MNSLQTKIFGNAFNLIPNLGPVSLRKLLDHFGSFEKAWYATQLDYLQAGLKDQIVKEIISKKNKINPEQSFAELARRQIEVLVQTDKDYPKLLKEISAAPPLLYVRGKKKVLNNLCIGVVGTRKMSAYGRSACSELVAQLIQNNVTVVSGLAFGIDAVALNTCIEHEGVGVAVLASDLDDSSISPRANYNLAQSIMNEGCLVSEFPLGMPVQKENFPIRNRIIAGMCLGTLVIEADEKSGALITANFALEQNREVFAIPGSIFSAVSRGTNHLIKQGAKMVTSAQDILEELNLTPVAIYEPITEEGSFEEELILTHLSKQPTHIDDLIKLVKLSAGVVNANLTILEMKGRVKNFGGGNYAKVR